MTEHNVDIAQDSNGLNVQQDARQNIVESSSKGSGERLFNQSEVNEIAGSVRKEAVERAKRELYADFQNSASSSISQDNRLTREEVTKMIAEENEKAARTAIAQKVARDFVSKIENAKDKYPDIGKVIDTLELPNNIELVDYVTSLDNTADVVYELGKNGMLRGSILGMLPTNPKGAREEILNISKTIKNKSAENQKRIPKAPLSQINPSTAGIDSEELTLADFKKQSWLRG